MTHNYGKGERIKWLRARVAHDGDECLIWPFSRVRGYGNLGDKGNILYAHRVICEMAHGTPPDGYEAAHSCGNGHLGCVNPKHLSWKTRSENQLDRRMHGTARGGVGYLGKMTPKQVRQIRALKGKKTHDEIASEFGTCRRNVGAILSGKTWANITVR